MIEVLFAIENFGTITAYVRAIPDKGNVVTINNVVYRVAFVNHVINTDDNSHEIIIALQEAGE